MSNITKHTSGDPHRETIHVPANTAWPIVLAFGCTLLLGGILLGLMITILGALLIVVSCIGWFRDVLPHEKAEYLPITVQEVEIETVRKAVQRYEVPALEHKPGELIARPSLMAGLKGGIVGGIAMAIVVLIYGQIAHGSIWYGVNLLGGAGVANWTNPTVQQLTSFQWQWFLIALVIHAVASVVMGLVIGALLPMLPSQPMLLGGIAAPLVWSGFLYASMGLINPELEAHISWPWFIVSQLAYGLVAGWVVAHDENFKQTRKMPLAIRVGLEAPGLMHENHQGEGH
ncbi:MAG: hypothetical protein ACP5M4_10570 [Acidobacteriaceae bacterium]